MTDIRAILGIALLSILTASTLFIATQGIGPFSLTRIEAEQDWGFAWTDGDFAAECNPYNLNSFSLYGKQAHLEIVDDNMAAASDNSTPFAQFHYGGQTYPINSQGHTIRADDLIINIFDVDDEYRRTAVGCETSPGSNDEKADIVYYRAQVSIPEDRITADITDAVVTDVSPGIKQANLTITVRNNWNPINVREMTVTVFGEEIVVDGGRIETGTHRYTVVTRADFYDPSTFLFNQRIRRNLTVHFKDPKIPNDQVSGRVHLEGSWWGRDQNSLDELQARSLQNFQSKPSTITLDVQYCGENASYVGGRCVIDEELHLRSDLCPLLDNHMLVTRTFNEGRHTLDELQPEPAFFCTKHPVLVTDSTGAQTEMITEPYRQLLRDGAFRVPEGQTYTLFWTVDRSEVNVSVVCEEGSLNPETGECDATPGVVHVCQGDAVWDAASGQCMTNAEAKSVCERGRYEAATDRCVFTPEVQAECPVGYEVAKQGQLCVGQASVERVCPDGVNGTVRDGTCFAEAKLVERNVVGDFRVAFVNLFDLLVDTVVFWK